MTIPYILYKTGPFDTITHPEIVKCFQINEKMLRSKIVYFNDRDCSNFIKKHFGPNIVKAYNMLIPGAYKADLWRLCILYIHGGIYGDLTQIFLREYNVNKDNADIILVRDKGNDDSGSHRGIYNAFISAKKHNGFIKYCIEKITQQILMKNKGRGYLDITGPEALKRHYLNFFNMSEINLGLQELTGIDNKIYKINVPFYHEENPDGCVPGYCAFFTSELNHKRIFINRVKNHNRLLYTKSRNYGLLYAENKVFKPDKVRGQR